MTKRIKWLDFGKGLAILGVVILHDDAAFPLLRALLLVCTMPAFFAISGYLYKPTNSSKKFALMLYKKITSFLIPYVAFTILLVIRRLLQHNTYFIFHHNYLIPIAYVWFLYALFFIFIIIGIMDLLHVNLCWQTVISLIFMFSQMFLPWQMTSNGDMNPFAGIGGYMICFILGRWIKTYDFYKILKKPMFLYVIGILWLIITIWQFNFEDKSSEDVFYFSNFYVKILSIFVLFSLFICFKPGKIYNYFTEYGKYTLVIYLVHFPIIAVVKSLPISNRIFKFLFVLILAWYLSIFACYLTKRFKLINFIFYSRKYINKVILKTKWGKYILESYNS